MRITETEVKHIKTLAKSVFGHNAKVYLFGSRVDDNKRGGDIDLFIECEDKYNSIKNISMFSVNLEDKIGEQKIDIVLKSFDKLDDRLIVLEALEKGILL